MNWKIIKRGYLPYARGAELSQPHKPDEGLQAGTGHSGQGTMYSTYSLHNLLVLQTMRGLVLELWALPVAQGTSTGYILYVASWQTALHTGSSMHRQPGTWSQLALETVHRVSPVQTPHAAYALDQPLCYKQHLQCQTSSTGCLCARQALQAASVQIGWQLHSPDLGHGLFVWHNYV